MKFNELFLRIEQLKVGIIGDVMLDTYMWGNVDRISPEAPVPIVSLKNKEYRIGGAGNVALNCIALKANTSIFSVLGNDEDGKKLIDLLQVKGINTNGIIKSNSRITTNKLRVISKNQQMMRLDAEVTQDIEEKEEDELLLKIQEFITNEKPQVIIFEDYNKGVLTEKIIQQAILLCKKFNVVTTVDPKRKNFFNYKEVDIFKPNLKEVADALNVVIDEVTIHNLSSIHTKLVEKLNHKISFITLSDKGVFFQNNEEVKQIKAHIRSIADVSGAGDTVIAIASLVYAATKNILLAIEIANIAGGLVCEEVGTVAIDKAKLEQEVTKLITM